MSQTRLYMQTRASAHVSETKKRENARISIKMATTHIKRLDLRLACLSWIPWHYACVRACLPGDRVGWKGTVGGFVGACVD